MSDFIKVNLQRPEHVMIINKRNLCVSKNCAEYHVSTHHSQDGVSGFLITREEYDRLCKELGVEE